MIHVVTTAQASLDKEQERKRTKSMALGEPNAVSDTNGRGTFGIGEKFSHWTKSALSSSNVVSMAVELAPVPVIAPVHQQSDHEMAVMNLMLPMRPAKVSTAEQHEDPDILMAFPMEVSSEAELMADAANVGMVVSGDNDGKDEILKYRLPPDQPLESIVPAFYVIGKPPHEGTRPFERRSHAYECLRSELMNIIDRREAGASKSEMQYDVLKNSDITASLVSTCSCMAWQFDVIVVTGLGSRFDSKIYRSQRTAGGECIGLTLHG